MTSSARQHAATPAGRHDRLARVLRRRLAELELPPGPTETTPISEDDVADLPTTARRYLEYMDVVGRPRHWSVRARFEGRFRLRGHWMPAVAWQYNTGHEISRTYVIRLRLAGVLPMIGTDTYVRGRGEMHGRLLGIVPVVHGSGDEFDAGELTTWLNDAVLLAPSFLLRPGVDWREVDDERFELTLTDAGRTVSALVTVDADGAPLDFSTTDRWADLPDGLVRAEWTTPVAGWTRVDDRPFPTSAEAIWHLPDGPMPYAVGRFVPDSVAEDVPAS